MTPSADIDLAAPFERDIILEVRSSKMKTMPGLTIQSGIDKTMRGGRINVSRMGLEGDEHDMTFHGGVDKAVHGYCCSHYPTWQSEFPEAAPRFKPGGFGENLVTQHMNERNVCIGDIVSVGPDPHAGLLLQVSLPRQPCFKLNHRFQLKNFAPRTYALSRTGWYYRVLREGSVSAGDEIRLVERRWPKWTIERVQEYLHRKLDDEDMNAELADIEAMGDESRGNFKRRVAKAQARAKRANGGKDEETWRKYRIVEKTAQTPRIASFVLEALAPDPDTAGAGPRYGSHARLRLPNGLLRSYSIVSGDADRFELGVALDDHSRGGSSYLHRTAQQGDVIEVGRLTSDVSPVGSASAHVFIVGGIGITAFLSIMEAARKINWEVQAHYAVRSRAEIPFRERIEALKESVTIYDASAGERMGVASIFDALPWNAYVYVCGPQRLMDDAARESRLRGLGSDEIHFEAFAADTGGDPFEVEIANRPDKGMLRVGGEETLLEVLRRHFDDVPSSCEVGNCGTCRIAVRSGQVDHRGTALGDEEKKEGMLSCVSRGIGRIVVEI